MAFSQQIILKYFPDLTASQVEKFSALQSLYETWNAKINVISRKDMENFYLHHVLHSLAIAKVIQFSPGTRILDAGTGGGFPGIPLAILFPGVMFDLVDSIGKKITVVKEIARALNLENVVASQARVEDLAGKYDFVVSRAVTSLNDLYHWVQRIIMPRMKNVLANGIICLKGGDLAGEIAETGKPVQVTDVSDFFEEDYFTTKKVVYLSV